MHQSNVSSLADFRAKRGLPEVFVDNRPPLERLLARYYRDQDLRMTQEAALRMLASGCAKAIVRWAEADGKPVDDAARFQFFAAGRKGREQLQVRVSRVGPPKGPWQALEFHMDSDTMEVVPGWQVSSVGELFKPILTLPMSGFYRLR